MKFRTHAVSMAAALFVSVPALAGAQALSNDNPITVQAVQAYNGLATSEATGRTYEPNTVDVSFRNAGSKPVSRVVFDVRSGEDRVGQIVDASAIAPGASVVRHYENTFDALQPLTNANVRPVEVDFSDGSVWKADA